MTKKTFVLSTQHIVDNACTCLLKHWADYHADGKTLVVEIRRETRRLAQNARYWAMLNEFSKWWRDGTKRYSADVLHEYFKREFIGIKQLPHGHIMACSSTDLTIDEFANYMTQVEAYMADAGFVFKEAA